MAFELSWSQEFVQTLTCGASRPAWPAVLTAGFCSARPAARFALPCSIYLVQGAGGRSCSLLGRGHRSAHGKAVRFAGRSYKSYLACRSGARPARRNPYNFQLVAQTALSCSICLVQGTRIALALCWAGHSSRPRAGRFEVRVSYGLSTLLH